jgi:hypothetical protein
MRKEGLQTWKRTVLNHVTRSQSLDVITGYNDHERADDGLSKFVYKEKVSIDTHHANGIPLLVVRIRQERGKLFCLYNKDSGNIGRTEIQPSEEMKITVGGAVHVAISLIETRNEFEQVLCCDEIMVTGIVLPLRREVETSRQNYWHILDFDWNVYEENALAWPGIWR